MAEGKQKVMKEIKQTVQQVSEKEQKGAGKGLIAAIVIVVIVIAAFFLLSQPPIEPVPSPPTISCSNGIQDGSEAGIDCGGSCFAECVGLKDPGYTLPSSVYDVAVDSEDRIYVVDRARNRVLIFSPQLNYLRNIGETGVPPGGSSNEQFVNPLAAVIAPDGKLYVSDRFNQRIQVFDSKLNYARTISESTYGSYGRFTDLAVSPQNKLLALSEPHSTLYIIGESAVEGTLTAGLNHPEGCASASDGRLFIADTMNHVVKVFDSGLQQIATIGAGSLSWPTGIALDSAGNIYVADSENKRVQIYNSDYSFKQTLSGFTKPTKVAIDSKGRVLVADTGANSVRVFDSSLSPVGTIEGLGWGEYSVKYFKPRYAAVGPEGRVFLSDEISQRIIVLDSDFSYLEEIGGKQGAGSYEFFNPRDLTVDSAGNIYVADKDNHRVQVFDSELQYVMTIGTGRGSAAGQFNSPRSVAVDSTGRIFVVDMDNERVQVFDAQGNYLASLESTGDYDFHEPVPITVDSEDNIYVASSKAPSVFVFNKDLEYVKTIDVGSDIVEMEGGIRIDSQNRLIVVDIEGMQVRMLNMETGEAVKTVKRDFNWPHGLAIMQNGNIVVADQDNYRLQVFDSELNFLKIVDGGADMVIETAE